MTRRSNNVTDIEPYELFAIRYGRHSGRHASDNFIGADPHESGKEFVAIVSSDCHIENPRVVFLTGARLKPVPTPGRSAGLQVLVAGE